MARILPMPRSGACLLALALLASCGGGEPPEPQEPSGPPPEFWEVLQQAQVQLQSGGLDEAKASFHDALKIYPTHPGANYELAFLYLVEQGYDRALEHIDAAIAGDPPPVDTLYLLRKKEILKEMGRQADALEVLEAVLEQEPDHAQSYTEVCEISLEVRDDDRALRWATKALEVDPDPNYDYFNSQLHYFRGVAWRHKKELEKAEEEFTEAIRICPRNPAPYHALGNLVSKLGRKEEGEVLLRTYARLNEVEEQIDAIRTSFMESEEMAPLKLSDLARLHIRLGQYRQADACCDSLMKTGRGAGDALVWKGIIKKNLREYRSAERLFREAIEATPRLTWPRGELAVLYATAEDESVRSMEAAWKTVEEARPYGGIPPLLLSEVHLAEGDIDQAITVLRRGMARGQGDPGQIRARIAELEGVRDRKDAGGEVDPAPGAADEEGTKP